MNRVEVALVRGSSPDLAMTPVVGCGSVGLAMHRVETVWPHTLPCYTSAGIAYCLIVSEAVAQEVRVPFPLLDPSQHSCCAGSLSPQTSSQEATSNRFGAAKVSSVSSHVIYDDFSHCCCCCC